MEEQEREWIVQIAQGNKEAFASFYHAFVKRLAHYLHQRIPDPSLVHDLLQETFVAVWKNAANYSGEASVSSWVYRIAQNKMMDALRTKYRRQEETPPPDGQELATSDFSEGVVADLAVQQVMCQLPPDAQQMVELVFKQGLSYQEVAERMNIPVGTVKSRVYHLKQVLRKLLEANGVWKDG